MAGDPRFWGASRGEPDPRRKNYWWVGQPYDPYGDKWVWRALLIALCLTPAVWFVAT